MPNNAQRSKILLMLSMAFLVLASAQAAVNAPLQPRSLRSQSGQFIVHGLPMGAAPVPNFSTTQVSYIRLDPALLAVSCERIKQAVLTQLDMRDEWAGTISVWLHPVTAHDEPIDIVSERHRDGWSYRVHMPDQVERRRVIQAIVQVLVQEMANRRAKQRASELPPWLVEGLSGCLQATSLSTLALEPETFIVKQRERNPDTLARIRELLRARPPLTLNELNWPGEETLAGPNAEVYSACAQFFVYELLRLKNGRANLGRMLYLMPEYHNWQTAFLHAFEGHFERLLDVDKWWTLNVVHLTSRDMMFTWTREQTLQQLDEILAVSAHVRLDPKELPANTQVKLQQALAEWPMWRQTPILLQKIHLLQNLRLRAPQELIGLVDQYRTALEAYAKARRDTGEGPFTSHPLSKDKGIVKDTLKKLDSLDAQRENLRQTLQQAAALPSEPSLISSPSSPLLNPTDPPTDHPALLRAQQEALRQSLPATNSGMELMPPAYAPAPMFNEGPLPGRPNAQPPPGMEENLGGARNLELREAQREALRRSLHTNTDPRRGQFSGTR